MLKLRATRLALKQTQLQVATRARMHPCDLSKIESGHLVPYPRQAKKLARALNLRPDELLDETIVTP